MEVEKGVIKVVWITQNTSQIHSRMFDDVEKARRFAEKKKTYLIFRLLRRTSDAYSWRLLPYGKYRMYEKALKMYRSKRHLIEKLFG